MTRVDDVVEDRITDCCSEVFYAVGFAWYRIRLVTVALRSPTNPLLMTPPHRRGSRKSAPSESRFEGVGEFNQVLALENAGFPKGLILLKNSC